MITCVYETIPPTTSEESPVQFEHTEPPSSPPLTTDPVSGYPVKRVFLGGISPIPPFSAAGF
jgi:hypothetical protein